MRLHVPATDSYFFPDVLVTPQPPVTQKLPQIPDAEARDICNVQNPVWLIEVVSAESEQHDRNTKWQHYQQIPELQNYLLIDSRSFRTELYFRTATGQWTLTEILDTNSNIALLSIGVTLSMAELYEDVQL